jgi:hypothetical protein
MKIAAKPDAKSDYISKPVPYCPFTTVNRKAAMNIYQANIAKTAVVPDSTGTTARAFPGPRLGRPAERFSGIRSSGQYCCHTELTRKGILITVRRRIRGRTAVDGMCS